MIGDRTPPPPFSGDQRPEGISSERPPKILKLDQEEEDNPSEPEMNPKIQRYLIAIEYIGTRFAGAQQQPKSRTVVGVLEDAFRKFIGKPVSIFCSSRTDAGVHALSNVCHVDVERISKRKPGETLAPHEPAVVKRAVNHFLQKNEGDIMIIDVRCIPSDFHSRYKAQERTYFYRLFSGPDQLTTFERDRAWHVTEELDVSSMQKACLVLAGRHDFSSFRAAGCQANSPIRNLEELTVTEVASPLHFPSVEEREQSNYCTEESSPSCLNLESEISNPPAQTCEGNFKAERTLLFGSRKQHSCIVITARARSFLYHQVRLIVGVLKSVGTGDLTVHDVKRILDAKTVTAASPMAPAYGLYLGQVKYDLPPGT